MQPRQVHYNLDLSYLHGRRRIQIGVIGDSHMLRAYNYLSQQFMNNPHVITEIRNYARGGAYAVSIDMSQLYQWSPDIVFILIGSNDLNVICEGPHSQHAHLVIRIWNACHEFGIQAFTLGIPNRYYCRSGLSPDV